MNKKILLGLLLTGLITSAYAESYVWVHRETPTLFPQVGQTYTISLHTHTFGSPFAYGVREQIPPSLEIIDASCGGVIRDNTIEWILWPLGECTTATQSITYTIKPQTRGLAVFDGEIYWNTKVGGELWKIHTEVEGTQAILSR